MRKTALSRMQRVHTVGTTISDTISMWLVRGSETSVTLNQHYYRLLYAFT